MQYTPFGNRLLVIVKKTSQNVGGLIIPSSTDSLQKAEVVSVGKDSKRYFSPGDIILFKLKDADNVLIDGSLMHIVQDFSVYLTGKNDKPNNEHY